MGMSFPLLVATRRTAALGPAGGVGALYALNTAGAALGVVLCVLALPHLGERLTLGAAAALQVLAAAWLWIREGALGPPRDGSLPSGHPAAVDRGAPARALACLTLTGLAGMAAEISAFRLLEPLTGPHLWGLVLLLVPVLLGLALGAALGGRAAERARDPSRALTCALLLAGVFLLALVPIAGSLPRTLLALGAPERGVRLLWLGAGTALALLPPMAALGACFPLAVRASVAAGAKAPRASGDLGAWNALGCVLGCLLAGFVLLPLLGAAATLVLVGALPLVLGPLWHLTSASKRRLSVALAAAVPFAVLCVPAVRAALLATAPGLPEVVAVTGGRPPVVRLEGGGTRPLALASAQDARLYAEWFGGRPARAPSDPLGEPLPVREGRLGSVALQEEPGALVRLRVNGMSEAQLDPERPDVGSITEVALGLLPALAHPAPANALVIGHGAGWTAEALLATDVAHVDVAELDATVLEAAADFRGHPLASTHDPRARLWLTDGRLLLRRAARVGGRRYDVIASQPSHPWVPGAGHLFTEEAYRLARAALSERGVFAQWLNLFEMSPELLRSSLATFRAVFPSCWLFLFNQEAVLLGFASEPALDPARWDRLLTHEERVRAVAAPLGILRPGDLWRHLTLDADGIERLAPAARTPLVVDDRPALELGLAWRVLTEAGMTEQLTGTGPNLAELLRSGFPPDFTRALPEQAARERWTSQAIRSLLDADERELADRWDGRVPWGTAGEARLTRAALARARGDIPTAELLLREAVAEAPENAEWTAGWIGMLVPGVEQRRHLAQRALDEGGVAARRHPDDGRVRAVYARLREVCGDRIGAKLEYEAALAATSPPAPPGTTAALARLLLVSDPTAAGEAPRGPELGTEMHALSLLRTDPTLATDRQALELIARLESRLGDEAHLALADGLLQAARTRDGRAARRTAWAWLTALDGSALGDALRATEIEPANVEGWELLALAHLQHGLRAVEQAARRSHEGAALQALGEALRVTRDVARTERRARAYLRWFGVSAEGLAPAPPQ